MLSVFLRDLRESRFLVYAFAALVGVASVGAESFGRTWTSIAMLLALPLLSATLGGKLLAPELAEERLPHLLVMPIRRWQLFAAKVGAGLGVVVVVSVISIPLLVARRASYPQEISCWFGALVLLYALGALSSLVCHRGQTASLVAYFTWIGVAAAHDSLRRVVPAVRALRIHWFTHELGAFFVASAALILLAALYVFTHADLFDVDDRRRHALRAALLVGALMLAMLLECF